jgi:general secretion pathway protein D
MLGPNFLRRSTAALLASALLCGSILPDSLTAQPPSQNTATDPRAPSSVDEALQRRGSVTFRRTPISEVIFTLSELWQVNIVSGSQVDGEVSGVFQEAPLREVLDAILSVGGYSYRKHGNSVVILPQEQVGSDDPGLVTRTIQLPLNNDPTTTIEAVRSLLSPRGVLQPLTAQGLAYVMDTPEGVQRIERLLAQLSSQSTNSGMAEVLGGGSPTMTANDRRVAYFTPQFVEVAQIEPALRAALGGTVTLTPIQNENRMMLMGDMAQLQAAEQILRALDVPRAQVRITALIYDVRLGENEQLGFDWNHRVRSVGADAAGNPNNAFSGTGGLLPALTSAAGAAAGGTTGGTGTAAGTAVANGATFGVRTFSSNFELQTFLQALDETNGTRLLADPTITVVDRNQANIRIVTRIPYQQLTQTQQGGAIGTTAFEEAGVILMVTPRISRDGTVEVTVEPEFSVLTGFSNGQPIIDSRSAQTVVRIADRQTVVIGGLRRKNTIERVRGVPCLKDIKYIGRLFKLNQSEVVESELIVFLRPEIVNSCWAGTHREQAARSLGECQLDRIVGACDAPLTPDTGDKNCPIHYPRPRPLPSPCETCPDMYGGTDTPGMMVEGGYVPFEGGPMVPLPPPQVQVYEVGANEPSYRSARQKIEAAETPQWR